MDSLEKIFWNYQEVAHQIVSVIQLGKKLQITKEKCIDDAVNILSGLNFDQKIEHLIRFEIHIKKSKAWTETFNASSRTNLIYRRKKFLNAIKERVGIPIPPVSNLNCY